MRQLFDEQICFSVGLLLDTFQEKLSLYQYGSSASENCQYKKNSTVQVTSVNVNCVLQF